MTMSSNLILNKRLMRQKKKEKEFFFHQRWRKVIKMESQGKHSLFKDQKNQRHVLKNGRFINK
jgi:hypothetical protein